MKGTRVKQFSPQALLTTAGLACAISVGLALVAQHRWGMQPCPWCVLQRMLFILLALLCGVAAALPSASRRAMSGAGLLVALGGASAALWQHFVAAQSASCALTLADRVIAATRLDTAWPDVFEVRASCAEAAVRVLGVPFEVWSLALFAVAGIVLVLSVMTPGLRSDRDGVLG